MTKLKSNNIGIFLIFFIYATSVVLSSSSSVLLKSQILKVGGMSLVLAWALLEIITLKMGWKRWVTLLGCMAIIIANVLLSRTLIILLDFMVIWALSNSQQNLNSRTNAILLGVLSGITFGCIVVLLFFSVGGLTDSVGFQHDTVRHSLGFTNSAALPNFVVTITALTAWMNRQKRTVSLNIVLFIINYIVMWLCNGRSAFFSSVFIIFSVAVIKRIPTHQDEIVKHLSVIVVPVMVLGFGLSVWLAAKYQSSKFIQGLNTITTGRVMWYSDAWTHYPVSLLGQFIPEADDGGVMLDNLYLTLLLRGGVLLTGLVAYSFVLLRNILRAKKDAVGLLILCTVLVNSVVSTSWMPIWKNFLLLALAEGIRESSVSGEFFTSEKLDSEN